VDRSLVEPTSSSIESVKRALAFEALLGRVFERFTDVDDSEFDAAVSDALADIGAFVGADRAYVIRYDGVTARTFMTHEWCSAGIPSSIGDEQGRSFDEAPRQQATLEALRVNEIRSVAGLPEDWSEDRRYLADQGITAILEVPLVRSGRLVGVIGFDSVTGAVPWTTEDIIVLQAVAALFAQVTERRVVREGLAEAAEDLAIAIDDLRRSEARFGALVDRLPLAVERIDRDGTRLFANDWASDLPMDLAGLRGLVGSPPTTDRAVADPLVAAALAVFALGEAQTIEVDLPIGGSTRRVEVDLTPEFNPSGGVETLLLVSQDVTERFAYEQALSHAATHDALTGLPNRAMFDALLDNARGARVTGGEPVAVLFIDLDAFKDVNDSMGHAAGDALLVEVAGRLRAALPAAEALARLGGDEFGVMLDGHDEVAATAVAADLVAALQQPLEVGDHRLIVSASIGIAVAHEAEAVANLLRWADIAMYRAKRVRRSGFAVYDRALSDEVRDRLRTDQWLRRALELDEVEVAYQPVVELTSGVPVGVEALVRWRPGHGEQVDAASFVPVAEANGTIVPIGRAVLTEACEALAAWRREGLVGTGFTLSVNVSARQLERAALVAEVETAVADAGIDPAALCLEVTETALIADLDHAASVLGAIREQGVRVAIDDFGTGYGSLALLQHLPVDELKLDRSFVSRLTEDAGADVIARAVCGLAAGLGLGLIAEGIETPGQRERLAALGCARAQGYLFSRPLDSAGLRSWLASR
jgi:diguanylate cyclase (GGDEF)-like protein